MHMPDVDTEDTTLWGWTLGHMVSPREDGGFVGQLRSPLVLGSGVISSGRY
jgi:hypothetical protein